LFAEIAACLIEHLKSDDLKTGKTHLQEKLSQILTSNHSPCRVSQMWSTMHLKLDFPRCKDGYVPHDFWYQRSFNDPSHECNSTQVIEFLVNGREMLFLITAPPGMGKSRASEELRTQLVLSGYLVIYTKVSHNISFWNKCSNSPPVKHFLEECADKECADEFQQRPDGNKCFVVLDGFDEVCPHYRSKVLAMIKQLLAKGTKVLITSRPQERHEIVKGLEQEAIMMLLEIKPFFGYQKKRMLQTKLHLGENKLVKLYEEEKLIIRS
jgi:NACHT domain